MKKLIPPTIFFIFLIVGSCGLFYFVHPAIVNGISMEPALESGDYIFTVTTRCPYLHFGDIVVFTPPNKPTSLYIKRVIALSGQTIMIKRGMVYVDGIMIVEPYLADYVFTGAGQFLTESTEYTLKSDEIFVLGDNRNNSTDSRDWGPVPCSNIKSKIP